MRLVEFSKAQRMALVGSALVFAALVCVCLAVQGPASGRAEASGARQGGGQSLEASEVAAQAALTDLVGRLEIAMGSAFGGAWFDPSGVQPHVGFTSPHGRRVIEDAAAGAGLEGDVIPTPVSSTWAQLQAAQVRWNDRLAGLFSRGEVSTSLAPDHNSVQVELSASVPASKRADLERRAGEDPVAVRVETLPASRFQTESWARCAKFAKLKAYCDPTLVSGQSINNEVKSAGQGNCTAGPLAIYEEPINELAATKTFLLTAGHCIKNEGAIGKKWYAFEKQGEPNGRKEIGKAKAALIQEENIGADVGVIEFEAEPWQTAKDPPLAPSIAKWDAANETEPFSVIKQVPPALNAKVCFSGQGSGTNCGKIIGVNKVLKFKNEEGKPAEWKEAFEFELEKGEIGVGDSGAPVFLEEPYVKNAEGHVLGIVVGGPAGGKLGIAQPLSFLFAELNKHEGLKFKLLTRANEKRHGKLHTSLENTTLTAAQSGNHVFTVGEGFGGITCEVVTFDGMQVEYTVEEIAVAPTYKNCKDSFGRVADVDMSGLTYTFHSSGSVDISGGMTITVTSGSSVVCTVSVVSPQTDNGISYANEGTAQIRVTVHSTNLKSTTSGGFFNCGTSNGEHTAGTYDGTSVVSGESAGEEATLRYE